MTAYVFDLIRIEGFSATPWYNGFNKKQVLSGKSNIANFLDDGICTHLMINSKISR